MQKLLKTMLYCHQATTNLMIDTIHSLITSVNARDPYTYQHSLNVGFYAWKIANQFQLGEEECANMYIAGLLHDIGKIGTPDSILRKYGELTKEEWELIKKHPETGCAIVQMIGPLQNRGIDQTILYHHERMDGQGYPHGLSSAEIPLGAKIVSVAEAFDAMTTVRLYRPALPYGEAVEQLIDGKGTQFDPIVVDAFLKSMADRSWWD
ncbi:HD-GYP domain-containing protein [Brevibacillus parabrevis]|uniref:HD-GYP domain-containing protein n=1 Tax=Brevibacillus parabrevis TaxID=54914 RepID=UPI001F6236E0|nr:HD-GYP domain-containing protein [Brevibacillus parabrevis]